MTDATNQPYDPNARRDTPLAQKLKDQIRRVGPITVTDYMHACLSDPDFGYYRTRHPLGAQGDFITAPEISQIFGELVGLWAAIVWQQMGAPSQLNLIELGPGRGTLLRDALRAAQIMPNFCNATTAHLIECNKSLTQTQHETLTDVPVPLRWHESLFKTSEDPKGEFTSKLDVPTGPTIVIANEFIDVVPVEQFEKQNDRWHERSVGLDEQDRLVFQINQHHTRGIGDLTAHLPDTLPGAVIEKLGGIGDLTLALSQIHKHAPVAALFIDYGHTKTSQGDTLQAVRNHKMEHPLCSPGQADLTAHVDFAQLSQRFTTTGLACDGPLPQAEFLSRLGIVERASKLMAANPEKAGAIETSIARLMAPGGMGGHFQVLGVRTPTVAPLPGL